VPGRKVGLQFDGTAQLVLRILPLLSMHAFEAEVIVQVGVVRSQGDGALQRLDGLDVLPGRALQSSQAMKSDDVIGIEGDGLAVLEDRPFELTLPFKQQSGGEMRLGEDLGGLLLRCVGDRGIRHLSRVARVLACDLQIRFRASGGTAYHRGPQDLPRYFSHDRSHWVTRLVAAV